MIHITNIDIYNTDILFLVGTTTEEFDKLYEKNKDNISYDEYLSMREVIADNNSCFGFTKMTRKKRIIVFIREEKKNAESYVVHECYHAVNKLLMQRGVNHDFDDEPFAYLLGFVVNDYFLALDTKVQ